MKKKSISNKFCSFEWTKLFFSLPYCEDWSVCVCVPSLSFHSLPLGDCAVTQEEGDTGGHAVKRIPGSNVPWRWRTKYPSFVSGHLSLALSFPLSLSRLFCCSGTHCAQVFLPTPSPLQDIKSKEREQAERMLSMPSRESLCASVSLSLSVYFLIEFKGELGNVGPELRSFH